MVDVSALPKMEIGSRVERLRVRFEDAGIDALLITRLPNVRYLTGFTGSAAMLLVTDDTMTFVTDGRYREQSAEQLRDAAVDADIEIGATQSAQRAVLVEAVASTERLGLEAHGVTWAQQRELAKAFGSSELVPTEQLVEQLRLVKEPGEVARIEAACAIGDETFAEVCELLPAGPTEQEVALALEFGMRTRGASAMSFDPIVASGPNGAKPHARPSDRRILPGELIVMDFGCVVDGYCSDMTRTVSVGEPSVDARNVFDVVLDAQARGREAVHAGAACADVDHACRAVITAAGWADAFAHSTGHGVGLEFHEAPWVTAKARDTLSEGSVVTVEPGVYLPGIGGVRIEDTVVVTDRGARILTTSPKELLLEMAPQ